MLLTQLLNLYFTHRKTLDVVHGIVNGTNTLLRDANASKAATIAALTGEAGDRREAKTTATAAAGKHIVMERAEGDGAKEREIP